VGIIAVNLGELVMVNWREQARQLGWGMLVK
jgi:hypothetical protein